MVAAKGASALSLSDAVCPERAGAWYVLGLPRLDRSVSWAEGLRVHQPRRTFDGNRLPDPRVDHGHHHGHRAAPSSARGARGGLPLHSPPTRAGSALGGGLMRDRSRRAQAPAVALASQPPALLRP